MYVDIWALMRLMCFSSLSMFTTVLRLIQYARSEEWVLWRHGWHVMVWAFQVWYLYPGVGGGLGAQGCRRYGKFCNRINTYFFRIILKCMYMSKLSITWPTYRYRCSGPFYLHGLTLISALISNYIHYKVWDEITYPFSNFNSATVEVWEWISNFIPHFTGHMIAYSCWDKKLIQVSKSTCWCQLHQRIYNCCVGSALWSNLMWRSSWDLWHVCWGMRHDCLCCGLRPERMVAGFLHACEYACSMLVYVICVCTRSKHKHLGTNI